jgi:hypothetical protein
MREEAVLLCLVETVDLVNEQERPLPVRVSVPRGLENFAQFGNAGEDGTDLHEMQIRLGREQPGDGGLAHPWRPPEHEGGERTGIEHHAQAALWPENVILADYIRKPRRAQTVREGPRPGVVGIGALRFCVKQIRHQGHRLTPPVHWHQCILLAIDTK